MISKDKERIILTLSKDMIQKIDNKSKELSISKSNIVQFYLLFAFNKNLTENDFKFLVDK